MTVEPKILSSRGNNRKDTEADENLLVEEQMISRELEPTGYKFRRIEMSGTKYGRPMLSSECYNRLINDDDDDYDIN